MSRVAHDLNNSLAPILLGSELLRMQYPESNDLLETSETSARRGADIVKQLLTFAKGVDGERLLVQTQHLLNMPHMDGLGFVKAMKHMIPDAGIIVASGRMDEKERPEFLSLGVSSLLDMPFTQETLVKALRLAMGK